jgi:chromosome segregation ATPase
MTISTKDEYIAKLKSQLDEWEDDLADLRAKAAAASGDVQDKIDHEIAELKVKWDEADARRRDLLDAADDRWDDMKDAAEAKWADLKVGVKDGIERAKSLLS